MSQWYMIFSFFFFFFGCTICGNLSSQTRDWTQATAVNPRVITIWSPGDSPHWLFWIKVDWEEVSERGKLWFFSVLLKAENKPHSIWRYKDILINKDRGIWGQEAYTNKPCYFNLPLQAQVCLHSSLTEHQKPEFLCPFDSSQIYCFFV